MSELMPYVNREVKPAFGDRKVVRQARQIKTQVSLASFKAEGLVALGAKNMEAITDLHHYRNQMAGDDPVLQMALGAIFGETLGQVNQVQRNLGSGWGM